MNNANPDLLVGDSYVADAILWTKTMKEQGGEIILPYDTIEFTTAEIEGETHTNGNQNALTTVAQIQNGEYVTVWPFDVTESKAQFPAAYE